MSPVDHHDSLVLKGFKCKHSKAEAHLLFRSPAWLSACSPVPADNAHIDTHASAACEPATLSTPC